MEDFQFGTEEEIANMCTNDPHCIAYDFVSTDKGIGGHICNGTSYGDPGNVIGDYPYKMCIKGTYWHF